jgi:alkylhydroperoxidase family enzyme
MNSIDLRPQAGWCGPQQPRLRAPALTQRGTLFRMVSWTSRWFGRADVPDVISALHINPRLFWSWLWFASRLMPFGRLAATTREKIILRTAWNTRSRYEWGQHVQIALRCGVTDAQILQISRGADACDDAATRTLMRACDEWHAHRCLSDATWDELSARYDERLRIEIMLLIGHYEMIAGFLNSTGLQLEPPIEATLQAFHQRIAAAAPMGQAG